jgi:hypothetical protein
MRGWMMKTEFAEGAAKAGGEPPEPLEPLEPLGR